MDIYEIVGGYIYDKIDRKYTRASKKGNPRVNSKYVLQYDSAKFRKYNDVDYDENKVKFNHLNGYQQFCSSLAKGVFANESRTELFKKCAGIWKKYKDGDLSDGELDKLFKESQRRPSQPPQSLEIDEIEDGDGNKYYVKNNIVYSSNNLKKRIGVLDEDGNIDLD